MQMRTIANLAIITVQHLMLLFGVLVVAYLLVLYLEANTDLRTTRLQLNRQQNIMEIQRSKQGLAPRTLR